MSSTIKKRLDLLEQRQPITGGYTFQDLHRIPFTAEVQARFKALYEPMPNGGKA